MEKPADFSWDRALRTTAALFAGGDLELWADLVQAGRLAVWRAAAGFDPARGVSQEAYVRECVQHAMNNCVRGEKRWQRRHVLEEPEALSRLLEAQAAAEDETDGGAFAEYLQDAPLREQVGDPVLAAALTHLPEATQDVLTLAYVHDLTDAEIAARLGRSVAAVKKQRQRALQGLREILQRSDMGKEEPASS